MANKDYNEIWLEAMDLLIYNRLQSLSYDQTVKAKIVKNMGNKTYTVEESNIKYTASSLNDVDYDVNDEVYVLVPNGDYTAQKLIIGKAQRTAADSTINFVSPLDSMVSIDKLPIVMPVDWHGLTANGEVQIICLASFDLTTQSDSIKYNSFYDTIGLSADFKTLFSQINMVDGHYGLMLELVDKNDKQHIALLDSREMFGDPYNYMTFFNQTKKFDIGGIDADIVTLKLYAYQQHDFKMDNGEEIVVYPPKYTNNAGPGQDPIWVLVPDILIENISIFFGHDLNAITDDTFKIHVFDEDEELHNYAAAEGDSASRLLYSSWFNKSEANEFIGFSDGVVDETYSEQDYSDKLASDWSGARLVHSSDIPPLRESLQIYYYADKVDSLLDTLRDQAGNELVKIITNLNIYLNKYGQEKNEDILEYVEDTYIPLLNAAGGFEEADSWKESYTKYLEAYKPIYDEYVKDSTYVPTEYPQLSTVDSMSVFNAWSELENAFATWFATLGAISENDDQLTDISSYVGRQYRLYKQSLKIIQGAYTDLEARIETINTEKVKLDNRLRAGASTFDLTTFEEEYQDFIEAYANKYCIYWYQSDANAKGDAWSGEGWVRDEIDPIKNTPGMPAVNGAKYEKKSETQYTAELSGDVAEVKFKAILFFNHVPHTSNEITFTNATPPEDPDAESPDDFITISHGQYSQATYNQYSTNFAILNVADSMVNRELIMEYHSVDPEITSAEALNNTTVYWYIPTQSTMLAYDAVKMKKCGYTQLSTLLQNLDEDESMQDDYNEYVQYLRDGYECFFKDIIIEDVENAPAINAFYLISRVYQDSSVLNTIYCKVKKNTSFYETSIEFDFNTFGTSGTQYTLSIEPLRVQTAIEHIALADNKWENKPLYVAVRFTDFNGVAVKNMPAIDFGWYLEGADEWAPVIANELTDTELAEAGIQRETGVLYYKLGEPDKRPDKYNNCYYTLLEANCYWNMINVETESEETMTLRAFYPLAQAEGPYYLDGPTSVIYNSLGSAANYLNKPYRLFNNYDNTELTDITWVMEYYDKDGKLIAELEPALAQYAPHLTVVDDDSPIENGTYLSPLMMYIHNWDIYCVVVAKQEGERLYSQPIYIGQNTWESAIVNSWNEQLTIDEENGIILSSMVGAGYKDEENRFHGVLMGDVGVKGNTDDVKTGVGLYGFHAGAQSFGFNVDGTAFLGKSGAGRIEFNGDIGLIRSSTWNGTVDADTGRITAHSTAADGMAISLKTGQIDAHNFELTAGNLTGDNYIILTSNSQANPLTIGKNFTVEWDGSILAKDGVIGSWILNEDYFQSINGVIGIGFSEDAGTAFWAGGTLDGNPKFEVTHDGKLTAVDASIEGHIDATEGSIGVLTISQDGTVSIKDANDKNIFQVYEKYGYGALDLGPFTVDYNSISYKENFSRIFISSGTDGSYTIAKVTDSGWYIGANGVFGVKASGMYCNAGQIAGWTINDSGFIRYYDDGAGHSGYQGLTGRGFGLYSSLNANSPYAELYLYQQNVDSVLRMDVSHVFCWGSMQIGTSVDEKHLSVYGSLYAERDMYFYGDYVFIAKGNSGKEDMYMTNGNMVMSTPSFIEMMRRVMNIPRGYTYPALSATSSTILYVNDFGDEDNIVADRKQLIFDSWGRLTKVTKV